MKRVLAVVVLVLVSVAAIASIWRIFLYRPPLLTLVNSHPKITISLANQENLEKFKQTFTTRLSLNNISRIQLSLTDQQPDINSSGNTLSWQQSDGKTLDYKSYTVAVNKDQLDIRLWVDIDLLREHSWSDEAISQNITSTFFEAVARVHTPGEDPDKRTEEVRQLILSAPADLFTIQLR